MFITSLLSVTEYIHVWVVLFGSVSYLNSAKKKTHHINILLQTHLVEESKKRKFNVVTVVVVVVVAVLPSQCGCRLKPVLNHIQSYTYTLTSHAHHIRCNLKCGQWNRFKSTKFSSVTVAVATNTTTAAAAVILYATTMDYILLALLIAIFNMIINLKAHHFAYSQ